MNVLNDLDCGWMLSPIAFDNFLGDYWGQAPLRISRNAAGYYSHLLPESNLEFMLHAACRAAGTVDILRGDDDATRCLNHAHALSAYGHGSSLRVNSIQALSSQLSALARNIEQSICCSVNINMYLTPCGKKALARHFDTHDVFVLQISGSKAWRIYDSPSELPLENLPTLWSESDRDMRTFRLGLQKPRYGSPSLKEDFILNAGDALYLPRGHWHEANSVPESASCHLTVGLQTFSYLDLIAVALGRAASNESLLRQCLPAGFATGHESSAIINEHIASISHTLLSSLLKNTESAVEDIVASLRRSHKTCFDNDLFQQGSKIIHSDVELDSLIRRRSGMLMYVTTRGGCVHMSWGTKVFAAEERFLEACRFIAREKRFCVATLPGELEADEKVTLVRQLLVEGLLVHESIVNHSVEGTDRGCEWLPTTASRNESTLEWVKFGLRPLLTSR